MFIFSLDGFCVSGLILVGFLRLVFQVHGSLDVKVDLKLFYNLIFESLLYILFGF